MTVRRFWFEFVRPSNGSLPIGVQVGCGVTAYDYEDGLSLLRAQVFTGNLPPIKRVIEDVDVSTLDPDHVLPNLGLVIRRGIWFPLGYELDAARGDDIE